MKFFVTTMALLLATPALAATAHPRDRAMIHQYQDAYGTCYYTLKPGNACDTTSKLAEKLEARGYCLVGKAGVGRPGKLRTQKEWEQIGAVGPVPKDARRCHPVN